MSALRTLRSRGTVHSVAQAQCAASASMPSSRSQPRSAYLGIDPTADGLHVGHLPGLMALRTFQAHGYRPIVVLGGATARVGDPSGRSEERPLLDASVIEANLSAIKAEIDAMGLLETNGRLGVIVENNARWYESMDMLQFLREVGTNARMGTLLAKESTAARLESESGMSYAEFTYPLLQAYDFLHLHRERNCAVQIGGSDQWGNIVAGCDLIRRTLGAVPCTGVTLNLITTKSGEKLGKTAGNAVWLNPSKSAHLDFAQYFLRVADDVVERMLLALTPLPDAEIAEIMKQHEQEPQFRFAQKTLSETVVSAVRGDKANASAKHAAEYLFGDFGSALPPLTRDEFSSIVSSTGAKTVTISRKDAETMTVIDAVVKLGLSPSKSRARTLAKSGAIRINRTQIADTRTSLAEELTARHGRASHAVLSAGKKNHGFLFVAY